MRLIALAAAPALALVWFLYAKGRNQQSPKGLLGLLFVLGGLATLLAMLLNHALEKYTNLYPGSPDDFHRLVFWLVGIGMNEELTKMLVLLAVLYPRKDFTLPYQGLLAAATVSLGFSAAENLIYTERYGTYTLLVRSLVTVPAHACFTIPMGVLLAFSKLEPDPLRKYFWLLAALGASSGLHGLYDALLSSESHWVNQLAYGQVLVMGWLAWRLMALEEKPGAAA